MEIEELVQETKVYNCLECGECTASCPISWFEKDYSPRLIAKKALEGVIDPREAKIWSCMSCHLCSDRCPSGVDYPRFIWGLRAEALKAGVEEELYVRELEELFLSGKRDGDIGIIREIAAGKTTVEGQDGGMVTSLLIAGLEKGLFERAIVVRRKKGFGAQAIVTENVEDIREARGSKYQFSPTIERLEEAILEGGKKRTAIVALPCSIYGIRRIQRCYPDADLYAIGLFCFETFYYDLLKPIVRELLGIDLEHADKIDVKKGKFVVHIGGEQKACEVKELEPTVRGSCLFCTDFTARLADISVGSVGSPDGYSTVITRSEKGEKLFGLLTDIKNTKVDRDEIVKLANLKKKRGRDELEKLGKRIAKKSEGERK
jgi:coenzyme F420 hydrogenase subunit beta